MEVEIQIEKNTETKNNHFVLDDVRTHNVV